MNDPPPHGFHEQLSLHHPQNQAEEYLNKMQMKHLEGKDQHVRRQPPPSSSISTMSLTSGRGDLGPYDNLLSSRSNADEEQLTTSSTQMDFNEFDMDDKGLIGIRHLNSVYRPGNEITGRQPSGSTTPIHYSQGNMSQNIPPASSCLSKSITNNNSSLSLMMLNNNSTKDELLIMNTYSKASTSNMTPPSSNIFQATNTLQSLNSNSSNNQRSTQILNNPHLRQMPQSTNIFNVRPQHMNPHHYPHMPSYRHRHHYPYMHPPSRPMHSNDDRPISQ